MSGTRLLALAEAGQTTFVEILNVRLAADRRTVHNGAALSPANFPQATPVCRTAHDRF